MPLAFHADRTDGTYRDAPRIPSTLRKRVDCEVPDDEGVPELWSALHEDASGLDDFLHTGDVVETSECLSDEAIVPRVRAADSGESDHSDDAVGQHTQVVIAGGPTDGTVSLGLGFREGPR